MSTQAVARNFLSPAPLPSHALSAEEVQQLSRILSRLSVPKHWSDTRPEPEVAEAGSRDLHGSPLARAKAIFNARQRRSRFFPSMMLGETGWEILLVLFIHDGLTRLCIRDVGQLVDAPSTTVLRWVKVLENEKYIEVRKHNTDRRISILDLTNMGRERFTAFLEEAI